MLVGRTVRAARIERGSGSKEDTPLWGTLTFPSLREYQAFLSWAKPRKKQCVVSEENDEDIWKSTSFCFDHNQPVQRLMKQTWRDMPPNSPNVANAVESSRISDERCQCQRCVQKRKAKTNNVHFEGVVDLSRDRQLLFFLARLLIGNRPNHK